MALRHSPSTCIVFFIQSDLTQVAGIRSYCVDKRLTIGVIDFSLFLSPLKAEKKYFN